MRARESEEAMVMAAETRMESESEPPSIRSTTEPEARKSLKEP